ncbi:GlxA family transcriptional regulator [Fodinibius sediminis]|uniref:Transcriptional regulator GlxA family, contains an amidase domain and an AraC-type DNA-binding HTH domain n=1 Tax=Fodinibius sediminis TaxID=1214077 RepID=A0A521BGF8_9BACT|nr:helix-turn-helix domain-containing protein [Fodinibius sediminis]SMO46173.1 Transcriptional regulator GlxA family, contains an amidase domain and an AraC-type DNA-binding HTH domain [Fodinibius sediminis]
MKHVSILIPRGHTSLVNIAGTHQIFNMVNELLEKKQRPPAFEVHMVGLDKEVEQSTGLFSAAPDCLMAEVQQTDLIVIPAIHDDPGTARDRNQAFIPWIVGQYEKGAEVASLCVGAFFLAATGLLNGKQCATHWMHVDALRKMYPEVHVVDEKILTEEDGIYTSGGAYAFLNLLLYLIEKYAGREIAILISKAFSIDIDRESQSPFIIFEGQKDHEDQKIIEAQHYIEDHYQDEIRVSQLARELALSRRTLERRFKKATHNTVTEYKQRVKVEAAKKDLETTRKNVTEVMYDVGYSDSKSFRNLFRRITGLTPVEYRDKYNKEAVAL